MTILELFLICFLIRILSLFKSIHNEKKLVQEGAVQFGKINSTILTIVHIVFYASCISEAIYFDREPTFVTTFGLILYAVSMFFLVWVIIALNPVWTVKLYIAKNHKLNTGWLFKKVKHPNYYLNVIPEIIAIALICQSYITLLVGFPIYMIPLFIRIRQENKVMSEMFSNEKYL